MIGPFESNSVYCIDAWELIGKLPSKCVDAVVADPDYNSPFYLDEIERICKGNIVIFCSPMNQFFKADEYLFWVKTPSTKNYKSHCGKFIEMILVKRNGSTFNQLHWSQMTGVYDDRLIFSVHHPFAKPSSLIERLLRIYTKESDIILDPFTGSGTVPFACRKLNRYFLACDANQSWVDHVNARLKK